MEKAAREDLPHWLAEREVLRCTHAEVGAYLLGLWGLPEAIVQAVAWHHRPSHCASPDFCPVGAVHVANVLEHDAHPNDTIGRTAGVDDRYLDRLGLAWRLPAWRAASLDALGEQQGFGLAARL